MNELAQLSFSVPPATAEAVANLLVEQIGCGVEQRDKETLLSSGEGTIEIVAWLPSSDVPTRVGDVETLMASLKELGTVVDPWSWESQVADPETWLDTYKEFFKTSRLGRRFVLKPSWETYETQEDDLLIELDPGQAFGTGRHASTKLVLGCLDRLTRMAGAPQTIADVGCGTGILSIAAAKLWPGARIHAIDNDPIATEVCLENIALNGVENRITVETKTAEELRGRFNLVLANMTYEVLSEIRPVLRQRLADFGHLILSGLISEQATMLCRAYTRDLVLEPVYSEEEDGWRVLLLRVYA